MAQEDNNQIETLGDRLENIKLYSRLGPREKLASWLGKLFKIVITDDRTIIGIFTCTDKNSNIVLENAWEYTIDESNQDNNTNEPRALGLAMVPGEHIKSICVMHQ